MSDDHKNIYPFPLQTNYYHDTIIAFETQEKAELKL